MHFYSLIASSLLAASNLVLIDAIPTINTEALVNLRIEGKSTTLFEGAVLTRGHNVTTPSGGNHHCDGTNNGTHLLPVATCTSALDDAAKEGGFSIDGTYFTSFDDFLITTIGGEVATGDDFWKIFVNLNATSLGGCQQEVKPSDDVLFGLTTYSNASDALYAGALRLEGPSIARVDLPVVLTVTNGSTGLPVEGADVKGQKSGKNGEVSLVLRVPGVYSVKAEKPPYWIRSQELIIKAVPWGRTVSTWHEQDAMSLDVCQ